MTPRERKELAWLRYEAVRSKALAAYVEACKEYDEMEDEE